MKTKAVFSWPTFRIDPGWTLFLDRDGVINRRIPMAYVTKWEEFIFLDGVLEALAKLASRFQTICIVTNQAGIEKELMTHEMLAEVHHQMLDYILYHGGRIDEIYYCPYTATLDPLCRKPNPGMALEAKKDFPHIEFKRSLMVGDSDSDIVFGNQLGMKTILVGDNPEAMSHAHNAIPDARMANLADVAEYFYQGR